MKKLMLIVIFLSPFVFNAFGQTVQPNELPLAVQSNFKKRFPEAEKINWKKDQNVYLADFVIKDINTKVSYSDKGEWKSTSWEIPVEYTPQAIKTYIATNFPKFKIKEVHIEEVYPALEKFYSARIAKKKEIYFLKFKISGEFVKKETEADKNNPKK